MEIAPPPPDPPGGGRMPHTHYGPVMGVARTNPRPKRKRHGESYIVVGEELHLSDTPYSRQLRRAFNYYPYEDNNNNLYTTLQVDYEPTNAEDPGIGVYMTVDAPPPSNSMLITVNVASEPVAEGRPADQWPFQLPLPSFYGNPFDSNSRWGAQGFYSGKEWKPL